MGAHAMKRREARTAQRHYAILGYLAEHGPCPADEIARELGVGLRGLEADLSMERAARFVQAEWAEGSQPPRWLYRLATCAEREEPAP